jgi:predicted NBD/HSP70 family sugar kinase
VEIGDSGVASSKGRPGVRITLDPLGAYALGLDVGTRSLTCVLLDLQMGVVDRIVVQTGADFRKADAVFEKLVELPERLVARAGISRSKVHGLCVSVPGLVDHDGRVVNAPLLEWRDYPLRERLAARISPEWALSVSNDAVAFAAAECAISNHSETENLGEPTAAQAKSAIW